MTIGEIIGADRVVVGLRAIDKTQLLQELAGRAATALGLDRRAVFDALQARENLGSTGLGKGLHCRTRDWMRRASRSRCSCGWRGRSTSRRSTIIPVDLVILLLGPV